MFFLFLEINTSIQQGYIKFVKSESKDTFSKGTLSLLKVRVKTLKL